MCKGTKDKGFLVHCSGALEVNVSGSPKLNQEKGYLSPVLWDLGNVSGSRLNQEQGFLLPVPVGTKQR